MVFEGLSPAKRQKIIDYKAEKFPSLPEAEQYIDNNVADPGARKVFKKFARIMIKAFKYLGVEK